MKRVLRNRRRFNFCAHRSIDGQSFYTVGGPGRDGWDGLAARAEGHGEAWRAAAGCVRAWARRRRRPAPRCCWEFVRHAVR